MNNPFDLSDVTSPTRYVNLSDTSYPELGGRIAHGITFTYDGNSFILFAGASSNDHQFYQFINRWI